MDNPFNDLLKKKYENGNYRTDNGSMYLGKIEDDEYLHTIYYGIDDEEVEELKNKLYLCNKKGAKLEEYISFLQESNGALLFGGSINLFGFSTNRDYEDTPTSIIKPLLSDKISKQIYRMLYIGNCPHANGGNMNFYLNLDVGLVVGYYKNEIVITWPNIYEMVRDLINKYDEFYLPSGLNKNYGKADKGVYNNIQKYIF